MSTTYLTELLKTKKFVGNVVVQIGDDLIFSIRQPDSGLVIPSPYDKTIASLVLNPTTIDLRRVTTTISSFSFKILDRDNVMSALVQGDGAGLMGLPVRIFLGRSNVAMDFADYFELPLTYIQKFDHSDNTFLISTSEQTERMDKPIYAFASATAVDLLAISTVWTMRDSIASFPNAGFLKIENEFVSYTGKDLVNNRFTGVIRGELNSTPAAHSAFNTVVLVETISDNPINIILKLLISGGGGGIYDTLQSGLAIDKNLIDIAGIEALRDQLFLGQIYVLSLYSISSALTTIENELLAPNNLRLTNSRDSKVSLAILDKAEFVEQDDLIDENTITKFPKWTIDGTKITNQIMINWDFDEGLNQFKALSTFNDNASIALYGIQSPLTFSFQGVKAAHNGAALIKDFGTRLLGRLATPTPTIAINTQIDKSLQNIGDKSYLVSSKIPAADGSLNFSSDLEIIARAINVTTGDVQFTLAFTSFTNFRSGFIAPSDMITSFGSQHSVNIALGRGPQYLVGWFMRLWDDVAQAYTSDAPNQIISIGVAELGILTEGGDTILTEGGDTIAAEGTTEDTIVFQNDFVTTLIAGQHKIRFSDYNESTDSQKRYCFISDVGSDFDDGKPTYKVTY